MQITLHQTHFNLADFDQVQNYIENHFVNQESADGIHLFSELFLTGYPLQDLCLHKAFIQKYLLLQKELNQLAKNFKNPKSLLILGGLKYELDDNSLPRKIENIAYSLCQQNELTALYTKQLLPNYDIFDELKYFTPGEESCVIEWQGNKIGILICEDMWVSHLHKIDPCQKLHQYCLDQSINLDLIVNLSASPFNIGKNIKRQARASEISQMFQCPFAYCNRVGAEDEIIFDGTSFIMDDTRVLTELTAFAQECKTYQIDNKEAVYGTFKSTDHTQNTWEELFSARLSKNSVENKLQIPRLSDEELEQITRAICFGIQDYANKNGMSKFTVALSGGIDSALVLALVTLSLKEGQQLEAIYMPSKFSRPISYDLSLQMCQKLQVPMRTLSIKFLHSTANNSFLQCFNAPLQGLADENIQSRLRGALLYTRSNQENSMVLNTSNKSEIAVGYSTQYGDSVGALSLIGDLYKSEVYQLAEFINKRFDNIIPEGIIERGPSAELKEDQLDSDSLPDYPVLDAILEGLLSFQFTTQELVDQGHQASDVQLVVDKLTLSEYKRYQFAPIIKLSAKSFGFGHRIPICKDKKVFY